MVNMIVNMIVNMLVNMSKRENTKWCNTDKGSFMAKSVSPLPHEAKCDHVVLQLCAGPRARDEMQRFLGIRGAMWSCSSALGLAPGTRCSGSSV